MSQMLMGREISIKNLLRSELDFEIAIKRQKKRLLIVVY